ncbi:hemerythrin domain-containing protein [Noviherbaspirillum pedocola]|uniref:Hemerythrin domain-containing protein n=1 Tax=Noviherbaspirillum pedocola TaxID=2801341 RepID=A0A934W394_9BURK|nr:hemerythrin domain-containing protein [Noviherbaspirillum pedocola]MBK4737201.1 hemerythrin domain-containing protein [Noviherbaspirillum pedocola]
MTAAKKAAPSSKTKKSEHDAIAILIDDHKRVRKMFKQFEKMKEDGKPEEKQALAQQICEELKLHTEVEEQIFYPAVRKAIKEQDMLDEAEVEHASAKDLIALIEDGDPKDAMWSARVSVLGEYVEHHVTEEEEEMFPKAKKAKLDMESLGEQIEGMKMSRQGAADGASLQTGAGGAHTGNVTKH